MSANTSATACGPDSLYYYLRLSGLTLDPQSVMDLFPETGSGTSLAQLEQAARQFGVPSKAIYDRTRDLEKVPKPAIVALTGSHFAVLTSVRNGRAWIITSCYRFESRPVEVVRAAWSGYGLVADSG